MPIERSLAASSHVVVVPGVGCDPPSLSLSSLSPSRCNLRHCLSPVSARCGPQTCPTTCSLLQPLSTSPYPSSACRQSRPGERSLATSPHIAVDYGVGCDPHSSSSSLLQPSHCELRHCLSPVSSQHKPRTRSLTCSSFPPSSTSSSPPSAHRQSRYNVSALAYGMSCSSTLVSSLSSPPPPGR